MELPTIWTPDDLPRFSVALVPGPQNEEHWGGLQVTVLCDGKPIGTYERNYRAFYDTFCPFVQDGRVYALYSPDYTATRLLSLPDCLDLGGEEPDAYGFCPIAYYVPQDSVRGLDGTFGFVAGCVWGDDSSWKVQFLDLAHAREGQLAREARFGYLELPPGVTLEEAVDMHGWDIDSRQVQIRTQLEFDIPLRPGERDLSLEVDERSVDTAGISEPPADVPGDATFVAQYFDDRQRWIWSQACPQWATAFAIAQRWAIEKQRKTRVWARSADSSRLLVEFQSDGSFPRLDT